MSSFYSAFVNTLLFFALSSVTVSRVILIMPLFAFCPLTSSAPELVMILSNAHPETIRLVSSAGPPVITPQRDSAPCCYFIQHHTRVRVFLAKNIHSRHEETNQQGNVISPNSAPKLHSRGLRTPLDINKHALEEFLPGCENVGVHKSWVNSGLTPASPAGGAVMDLVAVLLLYFSILHQL